MAEEMYMGGVGIKDRTREVTDEMWDALPDCYAAVVGVILLAGVATLFWALSPYVAINIAITALCLVLARALCPFIARWIVAGQKCKEHADFCQREVEKHGPGCAQS